MYHFEKKLKVERKKCPCFYFERKLFFCGRGYTGCKSDLDLALLKFREFGTTRLKQIKVELYMYYYHMCLRLRFMFSPEIHL